MVERVEEATAGGGGGEGRGRLSGEEGELTHRSPSLRWPCLQLVPIGIGVVDEVDGKWKECTRGSRRVSRVLRTWCKKERGREQSWGDSRREIIGKVCKVGS